jgi:hypothetical protein
MVEKKATVRAGTNSVPADDLSSMLCRNFALPAEPIFQMILERVLQLTFYAHNRINNLPQNTSISESKGGSIAV